MTRIGLGFGGSLLLTSGVQGFVRSRSASASSAGWGRGSLQLESQLSITPWFERRRGLVFGLSSTATATLMSLTPIALGIAIGLFDWRIARVVAALAIWLIVVPIARFGIIDRPSDVGQYPDGDPAPHPSAAPRPEMPTKTPGEAVREARFWVLSGVLATTATLVTALDCHQISVLGEPGLTLTEAAAMFLPQTAGSLVAGLVTFPGIWRDIRRLRDPGRSEGRSCKLPLRVCYVSHYVLHRDDQRRLTPTHRAGARTRRCPACAGRG